MKYLIKFDSDGRRGATYRDDMKTADERAKLITDGYIEVSEEDYAYYAGNVDQGTNSTGYVRDSATGKPVSAPARVVTSTEKATSISAMYDSKINVLKDALATATLAGDTDLITDLKTEYTETMTAYQAALKGAE
jgi:hypothetical protein